MVDATKNPGSGAGGDPMASAIKKAGEGTSTETVAQAAKAAQDIKDADALRLQNDIDQRAKMKSDALSVDERATIDRVRREQQEREKLRPAAPVLHATSAEKARPGEETVTMIFPNEMFIWAEPDGEKYKTRHKVAFQKGAQQVPVSLVDNWYLVASGVKRYDGGPVLEPMGPSIEEWLDAGYDGAKYPPKGFRARSTPEEVKSEINARKQA